MKALIIGGGGMLGHKLVQQLQKKIDVWTTLKGEAAEYEKFEIFNRNKIVENLNVLEIGEVEKSVNTIKPDVIINAVGIIKQIKSDSSTARMIQVNSVFPHQLADIAAKHNSRLINISTDCVFDGAKGDYTEKDIPNTLDLYGKSKNLGEIERQNCLTLRTSIIGRELLTKHSLVEWFLSNKGQKVKGFVNAIYTGFPTIIFAEILTDLIINKANLEGLYHISSKPISKYDLLNLVKKEFNADIEIQPFEDFYMDRSLNSDKFRNETGFTPMQWTDMIKIMADDPTGYK